MLDDFIFISEQYPIFYYVFIALNSVMVGSFLNVVIYRLPKILEQRWSQECRIYLAVDDQEEIVARNISEEPILTLARPRSACPSCHHKLHYYENIPIISWLVLRGKCSQCKNSISIRYPLVEGGTAILSVVIASHYGVTLEALFALILTWSLICLALIDYDHMLLPDQITIPLLWFGLLVNLNGYFVSIESAVIGAALGYGVLFCLGWMYESLTGKAGMGHGDYKLVSAFGAWLGWYQLPVLIFWASVALTLIGLGLIVFKGRGREVPLAFGPYLVIAGWLTLLYGESMANVLF
jgi:leader peptidase (prepilin peptidase)/N-methyltransferase